MKPITTSSDWKNYLEDMVYFAGGCETPGCKLYIEFGNKCSPCPFENCKLGLTSGTCGLRSLGSFLQERSDKGVESCDQSAYQLGGAQKDCLHSLLRRVQALERNDKDLRTQVSKIKDTLRKV